MLATGTYQASWLGTVQIPVKCIRWCPYFNRKMEKYKAKVGMKSCSFNWHAYVLYPTVMVDSNLLHTLISQYTDYHVHDLYLVSLLFIVHTAKYIHYISLKEGLLSLCDNYRHSYNYACMYSNFYRIN